MDDPGPGWLALFVLGFVTDLIWTLAVRASASNKVMVAATFNATLAAIALASTWLVIEYSSIVGAALYIVGSFVGTIASMGFIKIPSFGEKKVHKTENKSKKVKKSKKKVNK